MRLIKSILEFRYQIPPPLDFRRKILVSLTGKQENVSPVIDSVTIRSKEQYSKIIVESLRTAIIFERDSIEDFVKSAIVAFNKINDVINLSKSIRIGFRTNWISKEISDNFTVMARKFKEKFLAQNELNNGAVDVGGYPLVYNNGIAKVNITMGPMELEQLKQAFLEFQHDDLPNRFYFIDLDYFINGEFDLTSKNIKKFLEEGIAYKKEKIEKYKSILNL